MLQDTSSSISSKGSLSTILPGERFELTCFEDIYASTRVGVWMQQFDVLIQFRRDAAKVYGEPREALSHPEIVDEMVIFAFSTVIITDYILYCSRH